MSERAPYHRTPQPGVNRFSVRVESANDAHITVRVFANGASCGLLTMRGGELLEFTTRLGTKLLEPRP